MNGELLGGRYGHAMLIDGNDPRGIDVGLLCDADIELVSVRSNVDVLGPDSPLVDATALPGFDLGPRPGTSQSCSLRNRLDYILLSEELAGTVTGGGIVRKGLWGDPGNVNPPQAWEIYSEITASVHAASDHAAVWADLDL